MILRGKKKEEGQSTVEFALTLILLMGFVLFFFQLSMVFAFGNYVHYATFMSARAYLSAGPTRTDQVNRARTVIIDTLKVSSTLAGQDRFPMIARGIQGNDPAGFDVDMSGNQSFPAPNPPRNLSWLQGVRYTFRSRLFLLPFGGSGTPSSGNANVQGSGNGTQDVNSLTLTSESFLGREPADGDCQTQLAKWNGIYDNGC